jgi:hypothetical protein
MAILPTRHWAWAMIRVGKGATRCKCLLTVASAFAHPTSPLRALRNDNCLADGFGRSFIDYYLRIKEAEIARFQSEVTEWEQREYFKLF